MNKNNWKKSRFQTGVQLMAVILVLTAFLSGCTSESEKNPEDDRLSVITTLFPYYDFARAIAGDRINLQLILPPGQESHSFEPTAADLIAMEDADVLIFNGGEGEQWVNRVLESGIGPDVCLEGMEVVSLREEEHSENMKVIGHSHDHEGHAHEEGEACSEGTDETEDAHEGHAHEEGEACEEETVHGEENGETEKDHDHVHEEGGTDGYDEHIWTSPVNAILLTEAIRDLLIEELPQYEEEFTENANAYMEQLTEIDREIRQVTKEAQRNVLIFADRFPFLYFVKEYGLDYAAFSGCSHDTEPSAAMIAGLIDRVTEEQIPVIFHVEQSSRKTAVIIAESTGAQIMEFHSCHNVTRQEMENGVTYVELMRRNIECLKGGLGC